MNIAIIDDLKEDRNKTVVCLQTFFSQYDITNPVTISEFESGEDFLSAIKTNRFQFVFIDYYMDGISGLETAQKIREKDTEAVLIFITASSDYAVESYRVRASGYLVKPLKYEDFKEIMNLTDIKKNMERRFIELQTGSEHVKILLCDIIYCDIDRHYVGIHTHQMGDMKFRMSFQHLMEQLRPFKQFLPCYRGCIINMARVRKMEGLDFCMDNGVRIPIRKKKQAAFKKIYTDYLFEKVRESQS